LQVLGYRSVLPEEFEAAADAEPGADNAPDCV
jgi:hypothetical protein